MLNFLASYTTACMHTSKTLRTEVLAKFRAWHRSCSPRLLNIDAKVEVSQDNRYRAQRGSYLLSYDAIIEVSI